MNTIHLYSETNCSPDSQINRNNKFLFKQKICRKVTQMAIQIKDTPTLKGHDADSFFESLDKNQTKKIEEKEIVKIQESYKRISDLLNK